MGIKENNLQIAVVGRANVGKSALIDCIFNQKEVKKTEASEQSKSSINKLTKILPNGALVIIETIIIANANFSSNERRILNADFLILVLDAREALFESETELITFLLGKHMPFLVAVNKIEFGTNPQLLAELDALEVIYFELSCKENSGLESFRKTLIHILPSKKKVIN